MNGTVNRLIVRLAMLATAVTLGGVAFLQAQRGLQEKQADSGESVSSHEPSVPAPAEPIPFRDPTPGALSQTDDAIPLDHQTSDSEYVLPPVQQGPADYEVEAGPDGNNMASDEQWTSVPTATDEFSAPPEEEAFASASAEPIQGFTHAEAADHALVDGQEEPGAAPQLDPQLEPVDRSTLAAESESLTSIPDTGFSAEPEPLQSVDASTEYEPATATGDQRLGPPAPLSRRADSPPIADRDPLLPNYASDRGSESGGALVQGNGKPGPPELEGPQSPSLSVIKAVPTEIQVGKPAKFHVTVKNLGQVSAHDVLIRDEVPHGTELVGTDPPAGRAADGAIVWQMGTIKPGGEVRVTMEVIPRDEGDIGSVATVSFQTSASAHAHCTRPQLVLEHTAEPQVLIGGQVVFNIKLSNPGSGVATGVVVEEEVPMGLEHFDGRELEYPVGTLRPGETRLLELTLKAAKPGMVDNVLIARADANLSVEDHCQVEVVAPLLQVGIDGPSRRYLERKATYEIQVANPGTAAAQEIKIMARLPRALKFVSTNNAGQYDAQSHAVYWSLEELPAKEMGTVQLTTIPVQMGDHRILVEATANMGLTTATEHDVFIDGLAALLFNVTDTNDPVEVGGQTTYDIHVVNQGSKTATNLRVLALIPAGMEPINGEGPTRVVVSGQRVAFDPLARLEPQADTSYKVHVKGTSPGDKRVQVQLMSDEVSDPVIKAESTQVYDDQ
jgi:uncharacterized repeat protein (TIGR01451 family)